MIRRRYFHDGTINPDDRFAIYSAGKSVTNINLHANGQIPFGLAHDITDMKRTFVLPNWFYIA